MDWRNVSFDWNRARAFLVTAEEGSLSAAARALGMAQPTLGRQVASLEEQLGVALFERTGRGLALTSSGLDLLEHVRGMGDAAQKLALAASGHAESLEGPVCISASEIYSAYYLPPIIARLRDAAPGITVEIVATNAVSDLRRREADIAVRNARPTQPDLVARKLRDDTGRLYATPDYLRRIGLPTVPADLADADFLGFDHNQPLLDGLIAMGFPLTPANFTVLSGSHMVLWRLVLQGLGISVFPAAIGDADPRVVRVLPDMDPITFPIWLTAHREVNTSARVRFVFDLLAQELSKKKP